MAIITLLTDFGVRDEYVGVLKGVILANNPKATIIDITHGIDAQDIAAAAYTLNAAYGYFPDGSIHVAVVDPGVGTGRGILAARCGRHFFLAPDNGLLDLVLRNGASVSIFSVQNENLFRHPVSRTFHGRDIFAPVAARLSMGLSLKALGPELEIDQIQSLGAETPRLSGTSLLEGRVIAIDRFGNMITNLHRNDLAKLERAPLSIEIGHYTIKGLAESYAQGGSKIPIAIIGSRDYLEIAVNSGNAALELKLAKGDKVRVSTGDG